MSEDTPGSPVAQKWMPLPGFAKITKSLWGDNSPHITINVPQEQAQPQVVSSSVAMSRMVQDVWGTTIDMVTCQLNVMGLGSPKHSSTVTISEMPTEMPTLEDA